VSGQTEEVVIRLRLEYVPVTPPSALAPDGEELQLYSVAEAAKLLNIGSSLLYELIAKGDIKTLTIGKSQKISKAALRAFITGLEGGGDAKAG
jgi:excisionase family DNA binding protein